MAAQRLNYKIHNWETRAVVALAACASLFAFLYYFHHNQILLYGDAEGHINIARRVFDSRSPGPLQLGTVWLPLPHLLMLPFLISDWAWRTAVGGSIPSMIAYACSVLGIFRLVRSSLGANARFAAWFAVLAFAGNPSLIYLQTTAMTEPLYLAFFIWAVTHLLEFTQAVQAKDTPAARHSLLWCGITLAGCTMTRYDGWIAMAAACLAILTLVVVRLRDADRSPESSISRVPRPCRAFCDRAGVFCAEVGLLRFLLICAAGPLLWFAYNTAVYRNPIEFANGPYSAKAIEHRIVQAPHPGTGDPWMAELYFVRAVEMNLAHSVPTAKLWLILAALGTLVTLRRRNSWPLLLLWIPLPFYALSVAYSGVPIFVPDWWPFGQYNLRYGLQLLPAVAVFSAAAVHALLSIIRSTRKQQALALAATALWFWTAAHTASNPASFLEANTNMQGRVTLQESLAVELQRLPPNSSILMALRDFPGAPQRAGVPLRRIINENDQRLWIQPRDEDGLWVRALQNPSQLVDFAIGFTGDPVDAAATQHHLPAIFSLEVAGQPRATIYRAR